MHEKEVKSDIDLPKVTMSFIADFEGFRECAYYDSKQWSIGFGTFSHPGECITRQEAIQRKTDHIRPLLEIVNKDCYTDNQKIALVSFMYNTGRYAMNIDSFSEKCDKKTVLYIMNNYGWTIKGVPSKGLAKRRNIEIRKFGE